MEGVMMRNQDLLAVALRKSDGDITVATWPWFSLTRWSWLKKPFVRGFPVLLETLVNGIKALHFSAEQVDVETHSELKSWSIVLTMILAIIMAFGLFVVVPHLFSMSMKALGLSSDMGGLSFHIWDGFFKIFIFVGYIWTIGRIPGICRILEYHGAEHKVIWAYEKQKSLDPVGARSFSRLHQHCGTTFVFFVLVISIILHAVLVPKMLQHWVPAHIMAKHVYVVAFKILLMAPTSCLVYEIIKIAGKYNKNFFCRVFFGPGMALQVLTTKEPDDGQLEVAVAALKAALAK
ncbi:DUF1385 domain-containing protein [Desulfovibrionales bacterium]